MRSRLPLGLVVVVGACMDTRCSEACIFWGLSDAFG